MKTCKKIFILLFLIVLAFSILTISYSKNNVKAASLRDAKDVYSLTFNQLGGNDVMPIGCWWGPYNPGVGSMNGNNLPDYLSDEYFELIVDCGMNFITVSNDNYPASSDKAESVRKALELSKKYNLGYFVYDSLVKDVHDKEAMVNEIKDYINDDACIGIHVLDEPNGDKILDLKDAYQIFKEFNFKDKVLYTNLFPNYIKSLSYKGDKLQWKDYLELFLETTHQEFLSFDHYPFSEAGEGVRNKVSLFTALSEAKDVADKYEVPIWSFIQASGQWNDSRSYNKVFLDNYPSEAELLWDVNVNLAYGAKAIQYFLFIEPYYYGYGVDDVYDTTHSAMIGADGVKNEWYFYAQKANKQINAIDHVLMNATNEGVIAKGDIIEKNVLGSEKLDSYYELKDIDAKDALVGCFNYKGRTALYIVSNDLTNKQKVTLHFDGNYNYTVIQRGVERTLNNLNDVELTIEKGEGVLVVLN